MRSLSNLSIPFRRLRAAGLAVMALCLLLPLTGSNPPKSAEAPWIEGDWPRAFATPRPTLPGQSSWLEGTRPIPQDLRVRIHRVKEPEKLLRRLLGGPTEEGLFETTLGSMDPFDVLREAFLWSGRRTFVTAHRTATRGLRDTAREITRLQQPASTPSTPRMGKPLPLQNHPDLELVAELAPTSPSGQPNALVLPAQSAGVYIVELLSDTDTSYVPWLVTDLALLGDQDGGRLRVSAVLGRDGAPAKGASFRVYENGQITDLPATGEGTAQVDATPGVRRVIWASQGASHALMAIEGTGAASPRQRVYAYTDRPLYKPGHEVQFKAFVRRVNQGENQIPKISGPLAFQVVNPEGEVLEEGKAKLLNAATASYGGAFTLPEETAPGLYRILIQGLEGQAMAEFRVEHFIKPTFAVSVETPSARVGLGDTLDFKIRARYFHGAALENAKATWYLYLVRPARFSPWGDEAGPVPELKESGEVTLDNEGEGHLDHLQAKEEGLWRLVVKAEDGSGQRNQGAGQVRCAKGDLVLLVETDRELIAPGQPFKVNVRAMDLDGKEVQGVAIQIKACTLLRQPGMDGWVWSSKHRPGEVLSQAAGPAATLSIPKAGLHLILAEATDRSGRKVEGLRPVTVVAEGTPLPLTDALKASADRKEYALGDTARILVRLPRPNLTLRWSVENETVVERGSRKVAGTSTLVDIPLKAAHQPNAWAVFEVIAEGAHQVAEVPLRVPPLDKRLQVKVQPDRAHYQPGDTMKLSLEVKDRAGQPVAADLSVSVVDEAIYALCPELHPEPFKFFHPSRRHIVVHTGSTEWSFYDLMRRARPSWSLRQTRRGEFKVDDEARKNFKDTALWVPFLATDAQGVANTEVVLPDNLTAWRATALAMSASTQVGVGRSSRPSSKQMQVTLTLPRTLALGEESRAIALVQNLSGHPIKGRIQVEASGGKLTGPSEGNFELQDRGSWRFSVPLSGLTPGVLKVQAKALAEDMHDAEVKSLQVTEALQPAYLSGSVRLDGGSQTVEIPLPPHAKGSAMILFTPAQGLESLMQPSLPYLIQYPYGCVEQTLSSFMPNVLIEDLVQRKLSPPIPWERLKDLPAHITEGTLRVTNFQMPNGGWGWWEPEHGGTMNPHTTGYAIQSFAALKRLGHPVNESAYRRGLAAGTLLFGQLASRADGGQEDAASDAAFMMLSLSLAQEPVAGMLDQCAAKTLEGRWKGEHVLAMLALAAAETKHPKAPELLAALEKVAHLRNGVASWEGRAGSDYSGGDILPTVHALKALCLLRPASPLIPAGERFLASRFKGQGWISTWTTSQTLSLLPYLAKTRTLAWSAPPIKVAIEGGPTLDFKTLRYDGLPTWESRVLGPATYRMGRASKVNLTATGSGTLVWTYAYQVSGAASPIPRAGLGLDVTRQIWKLQPPPVGSQDGKGWIRQPWTGALSVGEEAWMEVDLAGTGQYGMLEVPVPAGMEILSKFDDLVVDGVAQGATAAKGVRMEVHPDRVCWFFPRLGPTRQHVRLWMRATLPGTYTFRSARVQLMSDESRWATSDALPLRVQDKEAR